MRAGKLIGIAAAVLGVAVVATVLTMARIQAVTQDKQAAPNIVIRPGRRARHRRAARAAARGWASRFATSKRTSWPG